VVEFTVVTKRIAFTVLPPKPPHTNISLLFESLRANSIEYRGVDKLELEMTEPVSLLVNIPTQKKGVISLGSDTPFTPILKTQQPMRLTIRPSRRDGVVINLKQANNGSTAWRSEWGAEERLRLKLRDIQRPEELELAGVTEDGGYAVESVTLTGGRWDAQLGMQLALKKPSTRLMVVNPQTGRISDPVDLPLDLNEEKVLLNFGEQIAIFQREKPDPTTGMVLHYNINVQRPEFYKERGSEEESFLLGGQIRFPAGEKKSVALEEGFILSVSSDEPLTLKSLQVKGGQIKAVLWGKPSSIFLGPTLSLRNQLLPSYFDWLYTHKLGTLVFTTIAWVVGACVGLLKLIGLMKS
jgi:hypothetical protein